MYEIQKVRPEFIFVPDDFYTTFKEVVKAWYEGFSYSFPDQIPVAQLCSVDHPIGFEFESSLIWFAGALLEVMEPNSGLEFATLHDLSAMERDWFEEDIRTLLDAENMIYMYEGEVRNNVILEVW